MTLLNPEKGDILLGKAASVGKVAKVKVEFEFSVWSPLALIKPNEKKTNSTFLEYSMKSKYFQIQTNLLSNTNTQKNIGMKDISNIIVLLPNLFEQQKIASFLDKKTTAIDSIIEKKEKLIEKLEAYKKSVITEAVTKGKLGDKYINEDGELVDEIEMKDSGVGWIGEIPKYFKLSKIKYEAISLNKKRIPISSENRGKMVNKIYDYYGASGIIDKVDNYIFDEKLILIAEDGANLVDRNKKLSFIADGKYWVNNHAHILKPTDDNNIEYLCNLLESIDFTIFITGSAQPKLTQDNLMDIIIPKPSGEIQNIIAKFIKKVSSEIDRLIKQSKKYIKKYKAYKKSLIYEAVTGKIDLRDYDEGGNSNANANNS